MANPKRSDLMRFGNKSGGNLIIHYSHATRESRKQAVSVLKNFVNSEGKKKENLVVRRKKSASKRTCLGLRLDTL